MTPSAISHLFQVILGLGGGGLAPLFAVRLYSLELTAESNNKKAYYSDRPASNFLTNVKSVALF